MGIKMYRLDDRLFFYSFFGHHIRRTNYTSHFRRSGTLSRCSAAVIRAVKAFYNNGLKSTREKKRKHAEWFFDPRPTAQSQERFTTNTEHSIITICASDYGTRPTDVHASKNRVVYLLPPNPCLLRCVVG